MRQLAYIERNSVDIDSKRLDEVGSHGRETQSCHDRYKAED